MIPLASLGWEVIRAPADTEPYVEATEVRPSGMMWGRCFLRSGWQETADNDHQYYKWCPHPCPVFLDMEGDGTRGLRISAHLDVVLQSSSAGQD